MHPRSHGVIPFFLKLIKFEQQNKINLFMAQIDLSGTNLLLYGPKLIHSI
jgi:hypothetical protein